MSEDYGVEILEGDPYEVLEELHTRNVEESGYGRHGVPNSSGKVTFRVSSFTPYSAKRSNYTGIYDYLCNMEKAGRAELKLEAGPSMNKLDEFREHMDVAVSMPKQEFGKIYQRFSENFEPQTVSITCRGSSRGNPFEAYENATVQASYLFKQDDSNIIVSVAATEDGFKASSVDAEPENAKACYNILEELDIYYGTMVSETDSDGGWIVSNTAAEDILTR